MKAATQKVMATNMYGEILRDLVVVTNGEDALVNLTPHPIKVMRPNAAIFNKEIRKFVCTDENAEPLLVIPPCGFLANAKQERESTIDAAFGIRLDSAEFTSVDGLPKLLGDFDPKHVRYIISRMYLAGAQAAASKRGEVLYTGNLLTVGQTVVRSIDDPTIVGTVALERV